MKLRDVIIFVAGAAVGGAVAAKLVSKKYEKIIDDEIESVKEAFKEQKNAIIDEYEKKLENNEASEIEVAPMTGEQANLIEPDRIYTREELLERLNKISDDNGYTPVDMDLPEDVKPRKYLDDADRPYSIYPGDVGELPGYKVFSVTLYSNGVATELVDTGERCVEEPIFDIDEILGEENFAHIGEIEPNMVYIRNDMYKSDYVVYATDDEYVEE